MAIDSHWNDTVLLMPFAGANGSQGIIDEKHHAIEITGSAVLSTTQAPAGCTSSLYLNGNNSYVSVISPADYDLRILFGEFVIEDSGFSIMEIMLDRITFDIADYLTNQSYDREPYLDFDELYNDWNELVHRLVLSEVEKLLQNSNTHKTKE